MSQHGGMVLASEAVHVMSGFTSLVLQILALGMIFAGLSLMRTDHRTGQIVTGTGLVATVLLLALFITGGIGL